MPHVDLPLTEIELNLPLRVEHAGMALVVVRTEAGVAAFEDSCPHACWPLSEGEVFDGVLECPGHGWEFHLPSGRCLNAPAYCLTPVSVTVAAGTVRMQWEEPDAAAADDAQRPQWEERPASAA